MISLLEFSIIVVRVAIVIPILYFIIRQSRYISMNGNTRRVRQSTIILAGSVGMLDLNLLWNRIELMLGGNPLDIPSSVMMLITNTALLVALIHAFNVFTHIDHE